MRLWGVCGEYLTEFSIYSTGADAITGERIFPGESVIDTNIANSVTPYMTDTLTRFVKESTIVWLAESAGYTLTRSDEGNPSDTEELGGKMLVGGGETPPRNAKTRGK
jgi:hypothetical protein